MEESTQFFFLGIDGGATKSTLVLINNEEKKIFKENGGPLNLRILGKKNFKNNFISLLKKVPSSYRKKIKFACFGLAGVDSQKDKEIVRKEILKIPRRYISFPFFVVNDIEIILPSIGVSEGVIAICGTGSNFFAKKKGKDFFAGGLDYILSDEGSAFDIGQKILKSAIKSFDGRGRKTIFEKIVFEKTKIKDGNIKSITNFIYRENLKGIVASFGPFLEVGLEKGDRVAKDILKEVIDEIFLGISAVAKKAGFRRNFNVALSGSVFHNRVLLQKVIEKIKDRFKEVRVFVVPEPEVGAAKMAKEKFQINKLKKI